MSAVTVWKHGSGDWIGEFRRNGALFALKVVRHVQASANWDDIAQAYLYDSADKTLIALAERGTMAPWPSDRDNWPALYAETADREAYCQANIATTLPRNWDRYTTMSEQQFKPGDVPTCGGGLLCHGGAGCSLHVQSRFDPRALRQGDVVDFGASAGGNYAVVAADERIVWMCGGVTMSHCSVATAKAVNLTPIADWVRDVQPGRLAEGRSPGGAEPVAKTPQVPETTGARRGVEAIACAACSRPITGRPLELDEGEVKLCPGDACVNAYARRCREAQEPGPCMDMDECSILSANATDEQIRASARLCREADDIRRAARDAAEGNQWHRAPMLGRAWTGRGKFTP